MNTIVLRTILQRVLLQLLGIGPLLLLSACAASAFSPAASPERGPVLAAVESPTRTPAAMDLFEPSYTNPVYRSDFPDPHVLLVEDVYYAYGTTRGSSVNIRVMRSPNLLNWEYLGDALPALPKWAVMKPGYTWAPGVIQVEDKFLMYYVARDKVIDRQCIGVGSSDTAEGPYRDLNDVALVCQGELGGSIDAYPYRDDDGQIYLLWKNDGNCCALEVAIWIQALSPDGLTLSDEPVKLIVRDQPWERPLVENPAMLRYDNRYYLFYSGNWWESHKYAVGYAVCKTIMGPCEKPLAEPWFAFKNPVMGPGGQAFFLDSTGNLWMAYHAWTGVNVSYSDGGQRSLHIDLVTFEGGKPVTNGPTSSPQLFP